MKESLKLIIFVLILGAISALVLIGVDFITKDRIAANRLYEFQSTVLKANEDEHDGDINEYFNTIMEKKLDEKTELEIYTHTKTGNISFTFEGKGLWDDIKGIITLKADWQTIVDVTITEQGETPGLGALVGERDFLDKLTNKIFNPTITIKKDAEGPSEVDSISGATGTSSQFQVILNNAYKKYYETFVGELVLVNEDELFEAILNAHGIEYNENEHLNKLIEENFKEYNEKDLRLFVNKTTARITILGNKEIEFAEEGIVKEDLIILITLNQDFKSSYNIRLVYDINNGHWGKRDFLNDLNEGKFDEKIRKTEFPNVNFVHGKSENNNEIDGLSGVTKTINSFNKAINELYNDFYDVYEGFDFDVEADTTVYEEILKIFNIENNKENTMNNFNEKFETHTTEGKELYINIETKDNVIVFEREYSLGKETNLKETLTTILVLKEDFKTVKKIVVIHDENSSHWAKTRFFTTEILDKAIDKKFPNLTFVDKDDIKEDNQVDGTTQAIKTRKEFNTYINEVYDSYAEVYLKLSEEQLKLIAVLKNNNIEVNEDLVRTNEKYLDEIIDLHFNKIYTENFEVFQNKSNGDLTYYFKSKYSLGRNLPDSEELVTIVTLRDNLETIVKMTVLHDQNKVHWGKVRLFVSEILDKTVGKNILKLNFVEPKKENKDINDIDLILDATTTRREFNHAIKDYYNKFVIEYTKVEEGDVLKAQMLLNAKIFPLKEKINELFVENFEIKENGENKIYINKKTEQINFIFEGEYSLGRNTTEKESLNTIVILNKDFETVEKLIVIHDNSSKHWGKTQLFIPEVLNKAIGKKLPELTFKDEKIEENDVDAITRATKTREEFNEYIKNAYKIHLENFKEEQ